MYLNLLAEITREKLDKKEIAKVIGKNYCTLSKKINGHYPFTLDEAILIQETFFENSNIKYLFKKSS